MEFVVLWILLHVSHFTQRSSSHPFEFFYVRYFKFADHDAKNSEVSAFFSRGACSAAPHCRRDAVSFKCVSDHARQCISRLVQVATTPCRAGTSRYEDAHIWPMVTKPRQPLLEHDIEDG